MVNDYNYIIILIYGSHLPKLINYYKFLFNIKLFGTRIINNIFKIK